MQQEVRTFDLNNIDTYITEYVSDLESVGRSIQGKTGVPLLIALKRDKRAGECYPDVSLFEAANRIMSDLVILKGISAILKSKLFPFPSYTVELGNENRNGFDIRASSGDVTLVGEAFNVAPSFFQTKKSSALKKLMRTDVDARYRILMFNEDAVSPSYAPTPEAGFVYVLVDIESGQIQLKPSP